MKELMPAVDRRTGGKISIVFSSGSEIISDAGCPVSADFFSDGYVEQEPEEIFESVISAVRDSHSQLDMAVNKPSDIRCLGISNRNETFLLWNGEGKPFANAVVRQCKGSSDICRELPDNSEEPNINKRTGLCIYPCFSGTKLGRQFRNIESARSAIPIPHHSANTALPGVRYSRRDYINESILPLRIYRI